MYLVIPEKAHKNKFAPVGQMVAHTNQNDAKNDAITRYGENGEHYLVLHDGKVIFRANSQ